MSAPVNEAASGASLPAHTPGPWVAQLSDTPYAELPESWTVDSDSTSVCTVDSHEDRREANARLIAAAPELLAAAQTVLAGLCERIDSAEPGYVPVFAGIADLSDAISKALGTEARS